MIGNTALCDLPQVRKTTAAIPIGEISLNMHPTLLLYTHMSHTDRQTGRHKQTDISTCKRICKHTYNIHAYRHTDTQTHRKKQADTQTYGHAGRQAGRKAGRHAGTHAYMHACRQTDRQTDGRTNGKRYMHRTQQEVSTSCLNM